MVVVSAFLQRYVKRLCSTSSTGFHSVILGEKNVKVPTFGFCSVYSSVDVSLSSLGPHDYPNLDISKIKILGRNPETKGSTSWNAVVEDSKLIVKIDSTKRNDVEADIKIPMVHSVSVSSTENANVTVSDFLESKYCHVKSVNGSIKVTRVKTSELSLETTGTGDIMCHGALQGSTNISTVTGNVIADKRFGGPILNIRTVSGDIRVASSYSEQSKFSTERGNMHLRNIHNESYAAVYEQGNITMHGIDGSANIFVKKGDIDVQISLINNESRIHSEDGDIHLKIMDSFPLKIAIDANEIIPDAKFTEHGKIRSKEENYVHYFATIQPDKFSPTLVVIAENGRVLLDSQSWVSTLGLKFDPIKDVRQLD